MSNYNFVQLALNLRTGERSAVRFTERDNLDGPEALRRLLAHGACSQHPNVIQLQVGECLPAFADRALLSAVPLRTNAPAAGTPTSPSCRCDAGMSSLLCQLLLLMLPRMLRCMHASLPLHSRASPLGLRSGMSTRQAHVEALKPPKSLSAILTAQTLNSYCP